MPSRARCKENVRSRCGGGARLIPAGAFSRHQAGYRTFQKRFRRRRGGIAGFRGAKIFLSRVNIPFAAGYVRIFRTACKLRQPGSRNHPGRKFSGSADSADLRRWKNTMEFQSLNVSISALLAVIRQFVRNMAFSSASILHICGSILSSHPLPVISG